MRKYIWLALILLVGAVLRFWHNTDISLWHDEAFSALLIKYPWQEMMYRIGLDVHPPMYYIALRLWSYVFGDTLLSLRGFNVLFGLGTVWGTWLFVKAAFSSSVGHGRANSIALWAALLVALNPFQVEYATEARMYTFGSFFAVMAAYFITKALTAQNDYYRELKLNMPEMPEEKRLHKSMLLNYFGFTVSIIVLIYTHYFLLFTAAALCFYALVYHMFHHRYNLKRYATLFFCYFVIAVSYIPWIKTFLFQYKQVQDGYWIPKMDGWSIPTTLFKLILDFGYTLENPDTQRIIIGLTIAFVLMFLWFLYKTQGFAKWLVFLVVIAPFCGAILFYILARLKGSTSSVYQVRYFLYTGAFISVVIAAWLAQLRTRKIAFLILLVYCTANLAAFWNYWKDIDIKNKPGMAAAAKMLQMNVEPGHHIFLGTSFEFFNYKYYNNVYNPTPTRPLLYTGGTKHAKDISHFAGSALLTDQDLVPNFSQAVKKGDTVWLLWTNAFGSSKPEIPSNWKQVDEKGYAEVRPYLGTWIVVTQYRVN